jgi:hypothetical protein
MSSGTLLHIQSLYQCVGAAEEDWTEGPEAYRIGKKKKKEKSATLK